MKKSKSTAGVPVFECRGGSISDDGHVIMNGSPNSKAMQAEADRLQAIHANGRVAMSRCANGPCDWPRINDPSNVSAETRERLVLCDVHTRALALA